MVFKRWKENTMPEDDDHLQNKVKDCQPIDTRLPQRRSRPVRFEVVGPRGGVCYQRSFATAQAAAAFAKECWPDLEQDEDRTGKGWDVQAIQPKRQL